MITNLFTTRLRWRTIGFEEWSTEYPIFEGTIVWTVAQRFTRESQFVWTLLGYKGEKIWYHQNLGTWEAAAKVVWEYWAEEVQWDYWEGHPPMIWGGPTPLENTSDPYRVGAALRRAYSS